MIKTKKDADFFFQGYACAVSTLQRGRVGEPALAEDVTDWSVKVGFCPGGGAAWDGQPRKTDRQPSCRDPGGEAYLPYAVHVACDQI